MVVPGRQVQPEVAVAVAGIREQLRRLQGAGSFPATIVNMHLKLEISARNPVGDGASFPGNLLSTICPPI
jgi:hypothetical protein